MAVPAGAVFFIRAWGAVAIGNVVVCATTMVLFYTFFGKTHSSGMVWTTDLGFHIMASFAPLVSLSCATAFSYIFERAFRMLHCARIEVEEVPRPMDA